MRLARIDSQLAGCLAVTGRLRPLFGFAQVEPELEAQTPDGLRQPIPGPHPPPAPSRLALKRGPRPFQKTRDAWPAPAQRAEALLCPCVSHRRTVAEEAAWTPP